MNNLSLNFILIFSGTPIIEVAVPDVVEAAKDADILIFVVPHQFITRLCDQLAGNIKATAIGLSLIKVDFPFSPSF